MKIGSHKLVIYSFTSLFISDALEYIAGTQIINFNPVFIAAFLKIVSLYCLIVYRNRNNWKKEIPKPAVRLFRLLIFWNIVTIIRGAIAAQDYWDWRFLWLSSFFFFCIPYAMIIGVMFYSNAHLSRFILKKIYTYALVTIPLSALGLLLYARVMISVWFYILLGVFLNKKWRLLIIAAGFFAIITGFEIRANVLRIAMAVVLMVLYYLKPIIKTGWLKIVCFLFFLSPFVFLSLGVSNQFNIFQPFDEDEDFVIVDGGKESSNLAADTRTKIYVEVFSTMQETGSWIWGGGATAKYKSVIVISENNDGGRYGSEVGFLNTLLYSGIIGVMFYFLILVFAAYFGLYQSNNFFCKMLAIFLAFRWNLFFVEDITKYDMNFYFLWIAIGICFSNQFRNLTDLHIKNWVTKFVQA